MSTTIFCIARHGKHSRQAGYCKLGSITLPVSSSAPATPAADATITIVRRSSLPLSPSLARPKLPA